MNRNVMSYKNKHNDCRVYMVYGGDVVGGEGGSGGGGGVVAFICSFCMYGKWMFKKCLLRNLRQTNLLDWNQMTWH